MEHFFLELAKNPIFAGCAGISIALVAVIFFISKYGTKIFFPGGISMESQALLRVEKKVDALDEKTDAFQTQHVLCREWQRETFVTIPQLNEWKAGRPNVDLALAPLWKRINRHKHDKNGNVIITEEA